MKWNKAVGEGLLGSEGSAHISPFIVVKHFMISNFFTAEGENGCLFFFFFETGKICLRYPIAV